MTKMGRSGLILALNLVLAVVAFAQTGSIKGTLVDSQGGVIAGASVRAMDQAKGTTVRETTSGPDGLFELQPLLPGTYTVRVTANGMKELVRPNIVLDQNQVLGLGNLLMSLGATSETVTVETTTPLVETDTSDHSSVIDSKQVLETQVNGRDFQSLMKFPAAV